MPYGSEIISPARKAGFLPHRGGGRPPAAARGAPFLPPGPGLLRRGAGARPAGLRLQPAGREGVQHGALHPASCRGRTCAQGRQSSRELAPGRAPWCWQDASGNSWWQGIESSSVTEAWKAGARRFPFGPDGRAPLIRHAALPTSALAPVIPGRGACLRCSQQVLHGHLLEE